MRRTLADAEHGAHAELFHRRNVEHLDENAELSQARCAAGELPRVKHVRRLVDEIARHDDAVAERRGAGPGLLRRSRIGAREIDIDLVGALLVLLAFGLITVERIVAQLHAEREARDLFSLERPRREFGKYRRLCRRLRHLSPGDAAKLGDVAVLEIAFLAGPHHDQARHVETGGGNDVERRSVLAGKAVGGGRPAHQIAQRRKGFLSRGTEFHVLRTERNENTAQAAE